MDFVPEVSAIEKEQIQIDSDTADLLKHLGIELNNVVEQSANNWQQRQRRN